MLGNKNISLGTDAKYVSRKGKLSESATFNLGRKSRTVVDSGRLVHTGDAIESSIALALAHL